jgi:hypothetical protein
MQKIYEGTVKNERSTWEERETVHTEKLITLKEDYVGAITTILRKRDRIIHVKPYEWVKCFYQLSSTNSESLLPGLCETQLSDIYCTEKLEDFYKAKC